MEVPVVSTNATSKIAHILPLPRFRIPGSSTYSKSIGSTQRPYLHPDGLVFSTEPAPFPHRADIKSRHLPPRSLHHARSSSPSETSHLPFPSTLQIARAVCHRLVHQSLRLTAPSKQLADSVLTTHTAKFGESYLISCLSNTLIGGSGSFPRIDPTVIEISRYFPSSIRSVTRIATTPHYPIQREHNCLYAFFSTPATVSSSFPHFRLTDTEISIPLRPPRHSHFATYDPPFPLKRHTRPLLHL